MLRRPPIFTKLHGGPCFSLHARTHGSGRFVITNMEILKMNNFFVRYILYFCMMVIRVTKIHSKILEDVILCRSRYCSLQLAMVVAVNR